MKKYLLWGLVGILVLFVLNAYFRADYLAFDRQREDWHRRCDAYLNKPVTPDNEVRQASCQQELQELLAYAKRKGWN